MAPRVIAASVALLALSAPASATVAFPPQEAKVKAVLVNQATLFKQGRWRAMYATYTPRFRRNCPYTRFVAQQRRTRRILGTRFTLQITGIRVESTTRAIAAYRFVKNGRVVARVTLRNRDVYTRIGSRWYDELDRVSTC
jgi:hypothetical protein